MALFGSHATHRAAPAWTAPMAPFLDPQASGVAAGTPAGMFGNSDAAVAARAQNDPSRFRASDLFSLMAGWGANLRDASNGVSGPSHIAEQAQMIAQRRQQAQLQAQQQKFMAGLVGRLDPSYQAGPEAVLAPPHIGAGAPPDPGEVNLPGMGAPPAQQSQIPEYQPPVRTQDPLNINSPDLAKLALLAPPGVPMDALLKVLTAQQPDVNYDRGFGYNKKTGAAMGQFHPELDKGQALTPDGRVMNLPGAVQSAAQMAGGVEGAKSAAQAPYQSVQTYDEHGRPMTINAMTLANSKTPFVGQSPAQTAADTARATAGASSDVNLPQTLASAQQTLATIDSLKSHPALDDRTGWKGVLPAMPGTSGVDFDATLAQLKGKLFLEAYGQLKGGGQITEVEGKKATEAMARLNQTQTKQSFVKALTDLQDVISAGAQRAAGQAARLQPNAAGGSAPTRPAVSSIPVADRLAEARRRGLLK